MGWIYLDRDLFEHDIWLRDTFSRGQAWVDLIQMAAWRDKDSVRIRGCLVPLRRGDVAYSVKGLGIRWGWSQGKVSRWLSELKRGCRIETKSDNVITVITVLNYDQYQRNGEQNGEQTESKRRANGEQTESKRGQTKEGKKVKEVKERKEQERVSSPSAPPPSEAKSKKRNQYSPDFEQFWDRYPRRRRTGKAAAAKVFAKLNQQDRDDATAAVSDYAKSHQGRGEFSPQPARWLRERRWEDDREAWGDPDDRPEQHLPPVQDLKKGWLP